jgi:hypothetical protein
VEQRPGWREHFRIQSSELIHIFIYCTTTVWRSLNLVQYIL